MSSATPISNQGYEEYSFFSQNFREILIVSGLIFSISLCVIGSAAIPKDIDILPDVLNPQKAIKEAEDRRARRKGSPDRVYGKPAILEFCQKDIVEKLLESEELANLGDDGLGDAKKSNKAEDTREILKKAKEKFRGIVDRLQKISEEDVIYWCKKVHRCSPKNLEALKKIDSKVLSDATYFLVEFSLRPHAKTQVGKKEIKAIEHLKEAWFPRSMPAVKLNMQKMELYFQIVNQTTSIKQLAESKSQKKISTSVFLEIAMQDIFANLRELYKSPDKQKEQLRTEGLYMGVAHLGYRTVYFRSVFLFTLTNMLLPLYEKKKNLKAKDVPENVASAL